MGEAAAANKIRIVFRVKLQHDMSTPSRKQKARQKNRSPLRPSKPHVSRKLDFSTKEQQEVVANITENWSIDENKTLVQFLLFYGPEDSWPSHSKTSRF